MAVNVDIDQIELLQKLLENIEGGQVRIDWINQQGPLSPDTALDFIRDTNGNVIRAIRNDSGDIVSFYQEFGTYTPVNGFASGANSNAPMIRVTTKTPLSTFLNEQGKVQFTGMGNVTLSSVGQAVSAISAGIALGKVIDKAIYNYYPADQLFGIDISNFDPDTWSSITEGETGIGAWAFNHIFGIDPETNAVQEYMDENELAYMARYLASKDITAKQGEVTPASGAAPDVIKYFPCTSGTYWEVTMGSGLKKHLDGLAICFRSSDLRKTKWIFYSTEPGQVFTGSSMQELYPYTRNDKTVYMVQVSTGGADVKGSVNIVDDYPETNAADIAWAAAFGTTSTIPGVSDEPGAAVVNLPKGLTQAEALRAINEVRPDLREKAITQTVVQPDGTTTTKTYVPVPSVLPSYNNEVVTGQASQLNPEVTPDSAPDIIKQIQDYLADVNSGINPTPSDTGTGSTIPVVFPVSHSLWAIYNPSQSEIDAFGAWLWSDNPIEQIKKIFANPMDAVIGVHKVFVNPPVAGRRNIKAGYLDSGVNSNYIGAQYVEVDCGTVDCSEYFGNVFDYYPHTNLELYLPFVGIVQLDPADVMRGSVNVKYGVDVLTGDCLAMVSIIRDGYSGILYSYPGNCAVRYPVTGGTYIGALASVAANAVLLTNGLPATVPLRSANVQHSGSFQGNCGATGPKIPYLIIRRPQTLLAPTFPGIEGVPSNHSDKLGNYRGFVKVLDCHLDTICATSAELDMISELLKEGVIV